MTIGISKIVNLSATFTPGRKDVPVALHDTKPAEMRIVAAGDWTVLFYDISTRQAWLFDGHSALLHICRAWLESDHAKKLYKHCSGPVDPVSLFQHASADGGSDEALSLLLNARNREIKLYEVGRTSEQSSKQPKTEEKEDPSWQTWGDIVDAQVLDLEYLRDQKIENRSKRTGDVKLPLQRQRLEGYDFQDMLKGNRRLQEWEVQFRSSFGGWLNFIESCNTISVFGAGFGDLLRPAGLHLSRHQTCLQKAALPQDNDYLAVSVEVLNLLAKDHLDNDFHYVRLGRSTYWTNPEAAFMLCTCDQASYCMPIARLSSSKPAPTSPSTSVSQLFMANMRGAVIFPCTPSQLKKHTPHKGPSRTSSSSFSKATPSSNSDQLSQHERNLAFARDVADAHAGAQPEDEHALNEPPNQNTHAVGAVDDPSYRPSDPVFPPEPSASGTSIGTASETETASPPNAAQHQSNHDLVGEGQIEESTAPAEHLENVGRSRATGEGAPRRLHLRKKKASQRPRKQVSRVRIQQTSIDWLRAWVVISTIVIAYLLAVIAGILYERS